MIPQGYPLWLRAGGRRYLIIGWEPERHGWRPICVPDDGAVDAEGSRTLGGTTPVAPWTFQVGRSG